jgi:hypothetical protein
MAQMVSWKWLFVLLFPRNSWWGHAINAVLYLGILYGCYLTWWALGPWWGTLSIGFQIALGYMSVPFLELLFPPPRNHGDDQ